MTSAGNDIVSFSAINVARTKQHKFYSKILTTTEENIYHQPGVSSLPFENFVWLLWSVKESAYKYLKRANPALIFTPVKFVVKQLVAPPGQTTRPFEGQIEQAGFDGLPTFNGIIQYGGYVFYSRSICYGELIVSVVNDDENFENIYWGIKLIEENDPEYQSRVVREFLIGKLAELLKTGNLSIVKSADDIPQILKDDELLPTPVSLSHHGKYVAYSFQAEALAEPTH
jgi:phosphopantetheinyl transferase (holo-ACP synthase)